MPYYGWGCFAYQSGVIIRVKEHVRVKVIVIVECILDRLGSPKSKLKRRHIIGEGSSRIRVRWLS